MRRILPAAGVAALALVVAQAGGASAATRVISDQVAAPFHLAVADGTVYVGDGGYNAVLKLGKGGVPSVVAKGYAGGDVAGVATGPGGSIAWTQSNPDHSKTAVKVWSGGTTMTRSTSAFEAKHNPDGATSYGVDNPTGCQMRAIKKLGGSAKYTGDVDSHPYAVASVGSGWVVADAGGNDLLGLSASGKLSLVASLPAQPFTFTPEMVSALGLPSCMNYVVYKFESVPTGVAVGADGMLYVSTLPGGPEDPSFGARGSVWKVDPATGAASLVATGFAGATDVTVGANGDIYVAELFGGTVTRVGRTGARNTVATLPGVVSVHYADGHLYAGTMGAEDGSAPGTVVRLW